MRQRLVILVMGLCVVLPARPARSAPASGSLDRLATDFAGKLGPALEGRRVPHIALLLQVRQPPGIFRTGRPRYWPGSRSSANFESGRCCSRNRP